MTETINKIAITTINVICAAFVVKLADDAGMFNFVKRPVKKIWKEAREQSGK